MQPALRISLTRTRYTLYVLYIKRVPHPTCFTLSLIAICPRQPARAGHAQISGAHIMPPTRSSHYRACTGVYRREAVPYSRKCKASFYGRLVTT
eukprot:363769-Chlamydomonas_euryale.AAC.2